MRHARFGYKAVITGWHARCQASPEWRARNSVSAESDAEPFYTCLVDIRDRPDAQVSYVPQASLLLLSTASSAAEVAAETAEGADTASVGADSLARLVVHPLVTSHFCEYRPAEGYYVPSEALAVAFPSDIPAFAAATVKRVVAASSPPLHIPVNNSKAEASEYASSGDPGEPASPSSLPEKRPTLGV